MIPLLIRLLIFAAVATLICWLISKMISRKPRFKCATCRHCARMDHDGVICRFGQKETFKNPTHITNCPDFEDDPRIRG